MKFCLGVKFSISTRVEENWCHTWDSTRGKTNISYFISPWGENIFAKICGIFYKNILRKTTFRIKLQDYIKTMMLDFISKRTQLAQRRCDKIVTTLWHGRKWELRRRRSPTLWQRRCSTLSRRCHSVATTLNNCFLGHFITDNSDFFPSKREKVTKVLEYWIQSLASETHPS